MVTILALSNLSERAAHVAYLAFFGKEFRCHRMGQPGEWFGSGLEVLPLKNPVDFKAFQNLMHGKSPTGKWSVLPAGLEREAPGWRITFRLPRRLSAAWAVGSQSAMGAFEQAHEFGVKQALGTLDRKLRGGDGTHDQNDRAFLFASFRAGTTWDQSPDLHTSVFLLNLGIHGSGETKTIPADLIAKSEPMLSRIYEDAFARSLTTLLGTEAKAELMRDLAVPLPANFGQTLGNHPGWNGEARSMGSPEKSPSENEALPARWQARHQRFLSLHPLAAERRMEAPAPGARLESALRAEFRQECGTRDRQAERGALRELLDHIMDRVRGQQHSVECRQERSR